MTRIWIAVALVAAISAATKALGPVALGGRTLPAPLRAVIAMLAPAMLAALIVVSLAGPHWSSFDWTIPAGLAAVVLTKLLPRAPDLLAILAGVVLTALLRLVF